ncbi:hypothetical protein THAOC_31825, partial [Thalassiosira oceanica]
MIVEDRSIVYLQLFLQTQSCYTWNASIAPPSASACFFCFGPGRYSGQAPCSFLPRGRIVLALARATRRVSLLIDSRVDTRVKHDSRVDTRVKPRVRHERQKEAAPGAVDAKSVSRPRVGPVVGRRGPPVGIETEGWDERSASSSTYGGAVLPQGARRVGSARAARSRIARTGTQRRPRTVHPPVLSPMWRRTTPSLVPAPGSGGGTACESGRRFVDGRRRPPGVGESTTLTPRRPGGGTPPALGHARRGEEGRDRRAASSGRARPPSSSTAAPVPPGRSAADAAAAR